MQMVKLEKYKARYVAKEFAQVEGLPVRNWLKCYEVMYFKKELLIPAQCTKTVG